MKDFRTIIGLWPRLTDFAGDIGVGERHANMMRFRNSVPPEYWQTLLKAASKRRIRLSYDDLTEARTRCRRPLARRRRGEPVRVSA